MIEMPALETARLIIRPFGMADLADAQHLLDMELGAEVDLPYNTETFAERAEWLRWTVLSYTQLAQLNQPPYGDRAIIDRQSGGCVGKQHITHPTGSAGCIHSDRRMLHQQFLSAWQGYHPW